MKEARLPTLTAAGQVAADLAAIYAHHEKPARKWLAVVPEGVESLIAGHEVLPHVQSFADAVMKATGVRTIGTYPGHSPSIDRALDLFTPVSSDVLGNAICAFAIANRARFGVRYIIYRQHIWHRLDPVWRLMEDRGDITQNHIDHAHISFEASAAKVEEPEVPIHEPTKEDEDMPKLIGVDNDRGIFLVGTTPLGTKAGKGRIPARYIGHPDKVTALVAAKVVAEANQKPDMPAALFDEFYVVVG